MGDRLAPVIYGASGSPAREFKDMRVACPPRGQSIDLSRMLRYFMPRLAGAVPTLFVIVTIPFFLIRAAPGGPFDQEQTLPPEIMANLQSAYGLDKPIWVQYGRYLGALAHGDFGPSFRYKDFSVTELIGQGFPVTFELGSIAMALALILGIPIGTFAALRP